MTNEKQRVDKLSDWYLQEQLDFDKRLIRFRYQTLKPYLLARMDWRWGLLKEK